MLSKIDTKKKLLLFPAMFIIIVILSGWVYSHWSNFASARNEAASKTGDFQLEVLDARISVYQFLRTPNNSNAEKVRDNFLSLAKDVETFKNTLKVEKNRNLCDEISENAKKYIKFFDSFADKRIKDFENGIKDESVEIKTSIAQMVEIGKVLESKLAQISVSAISLRDEANESLNNILIVVAIVAIILFIIISMLISNVVINSLNNFKEGLLSFFSF